MEKHFDAKNAQKRWNTVWEEKGAFTPDDDSAGEPFVITLPPPNVTGVLHVGHVLGDTVQDHLIRWERMRGRETLWVPGMDHAGIATQKVVEKALLKDGKSRADMTREEFLEHAWKWKEHHHTRIVEQMKNLGCALDWSREAFTLDEKRSKAVREAFVRLYEKGLIYRGEYIVNWCPSCQTALSDEEVEYKEKDSHLYWIEYPCDHGKLVVATTRPETMLGDTAVAVSPDDDEKRGMVGHKATVPVVNRKIPIVADAAVDKDFGSGFVKVTPAHDPNDFQIGQRHELPSIVVIGRDGRMTDAAGEEFAGLDRFEARKKLLERLEADGFLVKVEPYQHSVGHHDRCGTVIEPLLSWQWFVRMEPLAKPAIDVVERDEVTFYPPRWRNVYMSWMNNIRDWCISRQLWWGHRIPVWYCGDCDHVTVARTDPDSCSGCGSDALRQDDDVLDTWFSSWLWTFSPLGWPEETADMKRYHPTSVLVTGSEIIFFWVARMIMASLEFVGEIPFRHVFLTGIVRDGKGRKMSKSLGNSPDPLDIIATYGTDAFRFTLSMLSPPGKDIFFDEKKLEIGRNFVNKIWQASRMITSAVEKEDVVLSGDTGADTDDVFSAAWADAHGSHLAFVPELDWSDRWILSALSRCAADVDESFSQWRLNEGTTRIYDFFWHDFCDWYLELAKIRLYGDGDKQTVLSVLLYVLGESLKFIHPLMPYVTEEIWDALPMTSGLVVDASYPRPNDATRDERADETMSVFREVVTVTRNIRAQYRVNPGAKIPLRIKTPGGESDPLVETVEGIRQLARVDDLEMALEVSKEKGSATAPIGNYEVVVPLGGVVDLAQEYRRLAKEKDKAERDLSQVERKLGNEGFIAKAKPEIIKRERDKQSRLRTELDKLVESMSIIDAED